MKIKVNDKKLTLNTDYNHLLECLRDNKIYVDAPCSGLGTCGKCLVKIIQPNFISVEDKNKLSQGQLDFGYRLACTYPVYDGLEVIIDRLSDHIEVTTKDIKQFQPRITKKVVQPNFRNSTSTSYQKLLELNKMSYKTLRKVDQLINDNQTFYITTFKDQLIDAFKENIGLYGCAVDIGTTTVVLAFYDLENNKHLKTYAFKNPQGAFGADVISRITYEQNHDNLSSLIQDELKNYIYDFESEYNEIVHMVVSGNTTMTQLFLGLSVQSLGMYPFNYALKEIANFKLSDIYSGHRGILTVLPSFSAFVGSDILSGAIGLSINESYKKTLLIDLGTNGELLLFNGAEYYGTATAAGPVFEGISLSCGMQAKSGAVYDIADQLLTIDNAPPIGICGTGAISLLAWLYKNHLIDDTGRFNQGELYHFDSVYLTQGDIRALQTAKSAIRTGIEILLIESGLIASDIDRVFLAGGFGNNINIQSMCDIDLIPKVLKEKVICCGNSSLSGSIAYLMNKNITSSVQSILDQTTIVSLNEHEKFQEFFMDYMYMKKPAH